MLESIYTYGLGITSEKGEGVASKSPLRIHRIVVEHIKTNIYALIRNQK